MSLYSNESSLKKFKYDKLSQRKQYLQENVDKENIENQNKMVNYDKGPQQSKRIFQEIDKNRVQPANDTKNFNKSRFAIYEDVHYEEGYQKLTEKCVDDKVNVNSKINKRDREVKLVDTVKRNDILSSQEAYNFNYMNEFLSYQIELYEKRKLPVPSIMSNDITEDQRRLVISYLIRSVAVKKYPSYIGYQATKIFDFYINKVEIKVDELQTAALAALWIALKKDMIADHIPSATQLLDEFSGKLYQGNITPLVNCETRILMALNFEVSFADPFSILSAFIPTIIPEQEFDTVKTEKLYYYGSYLIDISSLEFGQRSNISAVALAVICIEISLYLETTAKEDLHGFHWTSWRNEIFYPIFYSHFNKVFSDECGTMIRNRLVQKVMHSKNDQNDFHIVFKKYNTKRYGSISTSLTSKVSALYINSISDSNYHYDRKIVKF